jgi:hypothetical protein
MLIFKLWTRESRCRRFNIKLATIFPTIVYLKYILMVIALPLFMDRLVFTCCLTGRVKGDFGDESITLIGWA